MRYLVLLLIVVFTLPIVVQGEYLDIYERSFDAPLLDRSVYRIMLFNDTIVLKNTISEGDVKYCNRCPADTVIYNVNVTVDPGPFNIVYRNYSCPFNLGSKQKVYLKHEFYVPGPVGSGSSAPLSNYSIRYIVSYWVWEWRRNNVTREDRSFTLSFKESVEANNTTYVYVYSFKVFYISPVYKDSTFTVGVSATGNFSSIHVKLRFQSQEETIVLAPGTTKYVYFTAKQLGTAYIELKVKDHSKKDWIKIVPYLVKTKIHYKQELTVPVNVIPRNITYILTTASIDDRLLRVWIGLPPWPRWRLGNYTLLNISIGQYLVENITIRIKAENLAVNGSKLLYYNYGPSIPLRHEFKPLYNNESITLVGEVSWNPLAIYGSIEVNVHVKDDIHGEHVFTSRIPLYCNCSWLVIKIVDDLGNPLQGVEVLVNDEKFLTGSNGTIYYLNRPPDHCLNVSLSYGRYRLYLTNLRPVTILNKTIIIDTHSPEITYEWNPWNRFLTVSISDKTRIKTITVTYGKKTINYAPIMSSYTVSVWIPKDYNGTVTITAEDIYNNTNTITVKVESVEEFRLGFKESILLTILTGTLAFMAYIARRMKLI